MISHYIIEVLAVSLGTAIAYLFVWPSIQNKWPFVAKVFVASIAIALFLFFQLYFFFTQERFEDKIANFIGRAFCNSFAVSACPPSETATGGSLILDTPQKEQQRASDKDADAAKTTLEGKQKAQREMLKRAKLQHKHAEKMAAEKAKNDALEGERQKAEDRIIKKAIAKQLSEAQERQKSRKIISTERYISRDGCMRERDGKIVLGFKLNCDDKARQ